MIQPSVIFGIARVIGNGQKLAHISIIVNKLPDCFSGKGAIKTSCHFDSEQPFYWVNVHMWHSTTFKIATTASDVIVFFQSLIPMKKSNDMNALLGECSSILRKKVKKHSFL